MESPFTPTAALLDHSAPAAPLVPYMSRLSRGLLISAALCGVAGWWLLVTGTGGTSLWVEGPSQVRSIARPQTAPEWNSKDPPIAAAWSGPVVAQGTTAAQTAPVAVAAQYLDIAPLDRATDAPAWVFGAGLVALLVVAIQQALGGSRGAEPVTQGSMAPTQMWVMANVTGDKGPVANPLDGLIKQLRQAPYAELRQLIAQNLPRLGPPFFLRIAELSDQATSLEEKAQLATFSQLMVKTLEQMYSTAEKKISEESSVVLGLLQLCAEPNGEFLLPLADEKLARVRATIRADLRKYATDIFVTTIRAYMKKATDDKLDGVVVILQKVLQVFVAELLRGFSSKLKADKCPAELLALFTSLLDTEEAAWDNILQQAFFVEGATLDAAQYTDMLNEEVGGILFQLPTGSALQQVSAEYVQEILERLKKLQPQPK